MTITLYEYHGNCSFVCNVISNKTFSMYRYLETRCAPCINKVKIDYFLYKSQSQGHKVIDFGVI